MSKAFPVALIMREDLVDKGYDVSHVTDDDMCRIAAKMGDLWLEQGYWDLLEVAANECGVPKKAITIEQADCGCMVVISDGLDTDAYYVADTCDSPYGNGGMIYKNQEAFDEQDGICYVPEAGFMDDEYVPEQVKQLYAEGKLPSKLVANDSAGYTRDDIYAEMSTHIGLEWLEEMDKEYGKSITEGFIDKETAYVFRELDWQCPSTFMDEMDINADWEEWLKENNLC